MIVRKVLAALVVGGLVVLIAISVKPTQASHVVTCTITIGHDGKSFMYSGQFSDAPSQISGQSIAYGVVETSDFIRSTTGPCYFRIYNERSFEGRSVTLGTDLNERIRAGIDGIENKDSGGGNTWRIRSLSIEYVQDTSCQMRIGGNGVRMTYFAEVFSEFERYDITPAMNRISYLSDNSGTCTADIWNDALYEGRHKSIGEFSGPTYDPGWRVRSFHLIR